MDEFTDYCARKGLSEEGTNKLKLVHFMIVKHRAFFSAKIDV